MSMMNQALKADELTMNARLYEFLIHAEHIYAIGICRRCRETLNGPHSLRNDVCHSRSDMSYAVMSKLSC